MLILSIGVHVQNDTSLCCNFPVERVYKVGLVGLSCYGFGSFRFENQVCCCCTHYLVGLSCYGFGSFPVENQVCSCCAHHLVELLEVGIDVVLWPSPNLSPKGTRSLEIVHHFLFNVRESLRSKAGSQNESEVIPKIDLESSIISK